jgi:cystathionine beta-lyase
VLGSDGGFEELQLEALRLRRSAKWRTYPADVLPAFVAESDFGLAPPIRAALAQAVEHGDTGYPFAAALGEVFAGFAARCFDWQVDPAAVRPAADVMSAIAELLRALSQPGDAVVVTPPVYPPFFSVPLEVGRRVVEAPLARHGSGYVLDLDALAAAFAAGARVMLLCHPHNPTGRSFRLEELSALAQLAARHEVVVISDEIHAPMTLPGARHIPYLSLGSEAAQRAVAVVGASKAWNIPGLKCALIVTASETMEARLRETLSVHLGYRVGHFGVLASLAAFGQGESWLDALRRRLDGNRALLAALLAERLPEVGFLPPEAGYLAWLDFRALPLGDDPAALLLEHGRVALSSGLTFGSGGSGFARLNFGTSPMILTEAVARVASGVAAVAAV